MHHNAAAWFHPGRTDGIALGIIIGATNSCVPGPDYVTFSTWNGRFCQGHASSSTTTGGSTSISNFGLSSSGSHNNTGGGKRIFQRVGSGAADVSTQGPDSGGRHSHTCTGNSHTPKRANIKLIQSVKNNAPIPVGGMLFSNYSSIGSYDNSSSLNNQSAYLYAHSSTGITNGSSSIGGSTSSSDSHNHHPVGGTSSFGGGVGCSGAWEPTREISGGWSGGGSHSHSVSGSMSVSLKARVLKAFERVTANKGIEINSIAMWDSANGSVPKDWYVCNGNNGTPDLRGYFIRLATSGLGGAEGNNTVQISASTNGRSHSHYYASERSGWGCWYAHTSNISHSHSGSLSESYVPPYRTVIFIQRK